MHTGHRWDWVIQVPGAAGPTASPLPARVSAAVQVSSILDCDTSYFNTAEQLQATENLFLSPFVRPGNLYRMQPACHYTTLKYYVLFSQNCRSITRQRKLLARGPEPLPRGPERAAKCGVPHLTMRNAAHRPIPGEAHLLEAAGQAATSPGREAGKGVCWPGRSGCNYRGPGSTRC